MTLTISVLRKFLLASLLISPFVVAVLPALVVPLAIYIAWNAPRAVAMLSWQTTKLKAQQGWGIILKRWKIFIPLVAAVAWVIIYTLESRNGFLFWIATITGNWTKESAEAAGGPKLFALSILVAIILNVGQFATVLIYGNNFYKRLTALEDSVAKNLSLEDLSLQSLSVIQGTSVFASADGKIDALVEAKIISEDIAEIFREIILEAIVDLKPFDAALNSLKKPGDNLTPKKIHDILVRGTIKGLVASLNAKPE